METQVAIRFDNFLGHPFFEYVPHDRASEIAERIQKGLTQIVFFIINGVEKFAAVIDFHSDCIHVSEVGGSFAFAWKYLSVFCDGLAKAVGVNVVTFKTYITAVKYLARKAGFALNAQGDFERVVQ